MWPKLEKMHPDSRAALMRRTAKLTIYVYHQIGELVPNWIMYQARQTSPRPVIYGHLFAMLQRLESERRLGEVIHNGNNMDSRDLAMWYSEASDSNMARKVRVCDYCED